jgi:hypothetical protein
MFGFILAGLSIVTGLPLVNAHVLLFPLVSLNIVTFFVLIRNGLNVSEGTAVVASIVYGFSGGLGWLVQTIVYHGQLDFWTLSFLTQDIYFSVSFWNNIAFSYKSLSLTLAYASIAALMLGMRFHETRRKVLTIAFSSVFMLFSFYIHMLEAFVFVPILLAVPLLYQKGRVRYTTLSLLALFSTIMSALVEFLMSNYYSWLAALKVGLLLSTVSFDKSTFPWVVPVVILAVVSILLSAKFVLPGRANLGFFLGNFFHRFKVPIMMIVTTPYLVGILLWQNAPNPSLDVSFPFPWYLNVTRYGLVGILALMGVLTVMRGERWFVLASLWCMVTLVFGGLWWGSRVNGYIFPMLALFAGLGITRTWEQRGTFSRTNAIYLRNLVSKSKPAFAIVVSGILLLSFTSVFYGANYYSSKSSPSDDEVRALLWIYENTPQDATVLVPNIYTISKGVETISDRRVYESSTLPVVMNANSFTDLMHLLNRQSSTYAVVREGIGVRSSLMDQVVAFSSPMFESGIVKVYKLPSWNPPSENYTLAVLDRQGSGSFMKYAFGWIDNDLTDGWSYKNVNVSTDSRVLALKWDFGEGLLEPSMRKEIPLIDTERYPYFIIRYRNTAETSGTAIENIGQIVTLLDKGGYPAGFLQNIYLPINLEQDFRVFVTRLPAKQSVASVGLWMRNYEQLNEGSIGLEIDFVGFSSEPLVDMRFLSMAIPALWPEQYAVSSEHDKLAHADTLVSAYDEDVVSAFEHETNIKMLVLLNATASVPSWGQNWTKSDETFVSGYLHEKRVIIVGMDTLIRNKDISRFAREVFERIR